jgi:Protein of unknown function (DUF4254)
MLERFASPAHRLQELLQHTHTALPDILRAVLDVVPEYRRLTEDWAQQPGAPLLPVPEFPVPGLAWAHRLHMYNFRLWHVEDSVRRPGAADHVIARSKRTIDTCNQQRHEHIEQCDTWLWAYLYEHNARPLANPELHSETPGNLLDRLSILTLKVYYMGREAERQDATVVHRQTCRQRLAVLEEQRDDIYGCLCHLCLDLWSGRKMFKIYRQFKMYNDPELNPEIYRHRTSSVSPGEQDGSHSA